MIIGMEKSKRDQIIEAMEESSFNFHLTGSRFFKTDNDGSDYDFFTENNEEVVRFLLDLGFGLPQTKYETDDVDDNCSAIMRHSCGVDVQLSIDVKTRLVVQSIIFSSPRLRSQLYDKTISRVIWKSVFTAVIQLSNETDTHKYLLRQKIYH